MLVTDALVLRRSDYRDYDRMVTLLSPAYGRLEACARGCRRPRSPLINAAELFSAGEYTFSQQGGRLTITSCQIHEGYYALRTDLDLLTHAAYCLFLLDAAAQPGVEAGALFMLGLHALAHLNYGQLPPQLITAQFEMHYMAALGQSPRMDSCVICGRPVDGAARFDASSGGVVCGRCPSKAPVISNGARRILLKSPRTAFDKVELLAPRPEWPEAAACIRRFVSCRIDQFPPQMPELITGENQ